MNTKKSKQAKLVEMYPKLKNKDALESILIDLEYLEQRIAVQIKTMANLKTDC